MPDIPSAAAGAAVATVLGVLIFLFKRRVQKASLDEEIIRKGRVLELKLNLERHGLSVSDLGALEGLIAEQMSRRNVANDVRVELAEPSVDTAQIEKSVHTELGTF